MRFRTRATRRLEMTLAITMGVGFFAGCSAVLGIESDRHLIDTSEGGLDSGSEVDIPDTAPVDVYDAQTARWSCINDPVPAPSSDTVQLKFFFNDVSTAKGGGAGKPIVGAEIHPCNKLDLACGVDGGLPGSTTDDGGIAFITVAGGFDGYYEVHAPNYTPAVLSRSLALSPEMVSQGMADIDLLSASAQLAGYTQDPNLAIAIVSVADCQSNIADGVTVEVGSPGPNESAVYFVSSLPSKSATATDKQTGSAIIFNVPLGTLTVTAKLPDQTPIRTVSALARKNWITFVQIRPDQATRTAF